MAGPVNGTFFAKAKATSNEIYIYDQIGASWYSDGITAKSFADELKAFTDNSLPLDVYMNSPGGSVFEGLAIYNQMQRYPGKKNVHIDGIAASIASVIAMAGDTIEIAENAQMMIHKAWGMSMGTDEDMIKYAASLTQVDVTILDTYVARSGGDRAKLKALVDAESWLTAAQALELGLVTSVSASKTVEAKFPMLDQFKNTPAVLRKNSMDARVLLAKMNQRTMKYSGASPGTQA